MMLRRQFVLKAEDSYIFVLSFARAWKNISVYYIAQEPIFYMSSYFKKLSSIDQCGLVDFDIKVLSAIRRFVMWLFLKKCWDIDGKNIW